MISMEAVGELALLEPHTDVRVITTSLASRAQTQPFTASSY